MRRFPLILLLLITLGLVQFHSTAFSLVGLDTNISKQMADEEAKPLFPAADYPFVQRPNHCGANDWTRIVPERPLCFRKPGKCLDDFTQACDLHDRCYMWIGMKRHECDQDFLQGMMAQCASGGSRFQQTGCRSMAKIYYEAVRLKAESYFTRIQKKQDLYEAWLKTWASEEEKTRESFLIDKK